MKRTINQRFPSHHSFLLKFSAILQINETNDIKLTCISSVICYIANIHHANYYEITVYFSTICLIFVRTYTGFRFPSQMKQSSRKKRPIEWGELTSSVIHVCVRHHCAQNGTGCDEWWRLAYFRAGYQPTSPEITSVSYGVTQYQIIKVRLDQRARLPSVIIRDTSWVIGSRVNNDNTSACDEEDEDDCRLRTLRKAQLFICSLYWSSTGHDLPCSA